MQGPCRCLLLLLLFLLLLCLLPLPPPAASGLAPPPPPPEDPRDLPPPPGTADPAARLLRGRPSAPVRPYSLSLSPEDYRYAPKPRHLRPGRLRRLLGSAFDPFWMSAEEPVGRNGTATTEDLESQSRELAEGSGRYRRKLWREAEGLELPTLLPPVPGLPPEVAAAVARRLRQWLVERAACRLASSWVDLGPVFWPRWVRHTACQPEPSGCSWPPGMALPSCPAHPAQAVGLALLGPPAPRPPALRLAPDPLPRGGRLQVLLPLRGWEEGEIKCQKPSGTPPGCLSGAKDVGRVSPWHPRARGTEGGGSGAGVQGRCEGVWVELEGGHCDVEKGWKRGRFGTEV
uniref:Noggin n=1 Tax=Anas platyrhynchos TaxID=8839 RepID=A0A8B9ST39_ANAPL